MRFSLICKVKTSIMSSCQSVSQGYFYVRKGEYSVTLNETTTENMD